MLDISYLSVNKCFLRCVFCFAPIPPTEPFLGQHCAVLAAAKGQVLAQFCFWFHALNMEKRSLTISRKTLNDIIIHCSILSPLIVHIGFFGGLDGKESACNAGDPGLIPRLGRSPGEGNHYPPEYSCLKNSMDCIVHGIAKSRTRLSNFHLLFTFILSLFYTLFMDQDLCSLDLPTIAEIVHYGNAFPS